MAKSENKVLMIYLDNGVMVNELTDEEAGKVFKSLFKVFGDKAAPLEMSGAAKMLFCSISNTINRQIESYNERNERRSQAKKAYWESKRTEAEPKIDVKP